MKKLRFLAWAVMAAAAISFSACSDDDTKDDGGKKPDPKPELSTECKLTAFKLVLADKTELEGVVYDFEKVVEVTYPTNKAAELTSATAQATISDKATISPDPNAAADYSNAEAPVKFTVTAEDGKTTATYTIELKEKVVKAVIKFNLEWEKKAEDGIKISENDFETVEQPAGKDPLDQKVLNTVAANGDKIVLSNLSVYDRTGANVGTLNTDGMGSNKLISLTNDFVGNMLASVYNPDATDMAGDEKKVYEIWVWKNGWNAAPERLLNSNSCIIKYISASGDLNSNCLVNAMGAAVEVGPHFCWYSTDGMQSKSFMEIQTKHPSNDGSWSQMVSAASASTEDYVFVYDPEYDRKDDPTAQPANVYIMDNAKAEAVAIKGPGAYYGDIYGASGWGNFTHGSVRGFTFNDRAYCLAGTAGWDAVYFTVINPKHPTYEPLYFYKPAGGKAVCPGTAYVNDAANNCAYLYLATPTYSLACVKVTLEYE